MPKIYIKNRDKLIICGLSLSKFDDLAYKSLGFSSFVESFNILGLSLQGKPSNIKNYRDEFDPYFDNARKGWYQRELRTYTKEIFEQYKDMGFESFKNLVSSFLIENYEEKLQVNEFLDSKIEIGFIKRVATGKVAEQYFRANFMQYFKGFSLFDSRDFGCGFDFKMQNEKEFYCVEVKGLSEISGNFMLTEKEYNVAQSLQDKYCLYIVSNLKEKPRENVFFNPIKCFNFAKQSRQITQTSYQGSFNI
ncbi:DUF3883 domain-containing protein [Campylobacter vulpis]|uniref:Protein NO VEIN C-terminal domain-containing protein n=1 Tax=Campylobacter vulpis TaxID=1655500 RepID=A0A2G4R418_9BACT|nr:DUF3883 domain-containing protein [Campylobacter vulpis]MBS4331776.1 DUF3883 domain-containing protein [Campylobacter vulpis]MBS4439976.1 DUF3883 domain-containing protein [Campylobacter vulpis]PHY91301.1 hypothetical protein AA994_02815 [Campylobacter vulpis]